MESEKEPQDLESRLLPVRAPVTLTDEEMRFSTDFLAAMFYRDATCAVYNKCRYDSVTRKDMLEMLTETHGTLQKYDLVRALDKDDATEAKDIYLGWHGPVRKRMAVLVNERMSDEDKTLIRKHWRMVYTWWWVVISILLAIVSAAAAFLVPWKIDGPELVLATFSVISSISAMISAAVLIDRNRAWWAAQCALVERGKGT